MHRNDEAEHFEYGRFSARGGRLPRAGVYRLLPDGTKTDICRRYEVQRELVQAYRQNGNALLLALSVPAPSDYNAIVSYYAGDC